MRKDLLCFSEYKQLPNNLQPPLSSTLTCYNPVSPLSSHLRTDSHPNADVTPAKTGAKIPHLCQLLAARNTLALCGSPGFSHLNHLFFTRIAHHSLASWLDFGSTCFWLFLSLIIPFSQIFGSCPDPSFTISVAWWNSTLCLVVWKDPTFLP